MYGKVSWGNYEFEICDINDKRREAPGVFMFVKHIDEHGRRVLFVGETDNFSGIHLHKIWDEAKELGMTHVHFFEKHDPDERKKIKEILIKRVRPDLYGENSHCRIEWNSFGDGVATFNLVGAGFECLVPAQLDDSLRTKLNVDHIVGLMCLRKTLLEGKSDVPAELVDRFVVEIDRQLPGWVSV